MTNYENVKNTSFEEMRDYCFTQKSCEGCLFCVPDTDDVCAVIFKKWLEEEVREVENG